MVRVHPSGSATVYTGTSPHGQGHETGFAQIVGRPPRHRPRAGRGDPRRHRPGPLGMGHLRLAHRGRGRRGGRPRGGEGGARRPSRSSPHKLEAEPEDIELADGKYRRAGLARQGHDAGRGRGRGLHPARTCPTGMEPGLEETRRSTTPRTSCSRSARTRASSTSTPRPARSRSSATSRSTTAARRSTRC